MRGKYVLNEVLVGLWRNVTMTIAMIITMSVSLTMLGASVLLYWQVDQMEKALSDAQQTAETLPAPKLNRFRECRSRFGAAFSRAADFQACSASPTSPASQTRDSAK